MAAPRWTQMQAPSSATSVNALSSAGDLFNKAIDQARGGIKSYQSGVDARLKEDSDVNTAALRRQLEGATDLAGLNAMQGDISATALEGYGKRIDADALQTSFNKERGVLRGANENQYKEQLALDQLGVTDTAGQESLIAGLRAQQAANPYMDLSSQISSAGGQLKSYQGKDQQTAANTEIGLMQSTNDIAALESQLSGLDKSSPEYLSLVDAINSRKGVIYNEQQGKFDRDLAEQITAAANQGQSALNDLRDKVTSPEYTAQYGTQINTGKVAGMFEESTNRALGKTQDRLVEEFENNTQAFKQQNITAMQTAVERVEGASQYVSIDSAGNMTIDPATPNDMRNKLQAAAEAHGFEKEPSTQDRETRFKNQLNELNLSTTTKSALVQGREALRTESNTLKGEHKATYDGQVSASVATRTMDTEIAQNAYDNILEHSDFANAYSGALDKAQTVTDFVKDTLDTNMFPDFLQWDNGQDAVADTVNKIRSGDLRIKDASGAYMDESLISDFILKASIQDSLQGNWKVDNEATLIANVEKNISKNLADTSFQRKSNAFVNLQQTKATAELNHQSRISGYLSTARRDSGIRSNKGNAQQLAFRKAIEKAKVKTEGNTGGDDSKVVVPKVAPDTASIAELRNKVSSLQDITKSDLKPIAALEAFKGAEVELNNAVALGHFKTEEALVKFFNKVTRKNQWGNIRTIGGGFGREIDNLNISSEDKESIEDAFKLRMKIANDR